MKHGIGQITRPAGGTELEPHQVAEFVNEVYKEMVKVLGENLKNFLK